MSEADESPVLYDQTGPVAVVSLNRPRYRNAQNSAVTYALDAAFHRAAMDDSVAVIVLRGNGEHFSAGHDIGSPGRDIDVSYPRRTMWPDHVGKPGIEGRLNRESEVYLDLVRRWRDLPKPTIAAVQGACIAGALMLAWACDLIVAADNAYFSDPVLRMGVPGVEYFAHPWQMGPRFAKEFLFLGERIDAARARELGMVNRVVPLAELDATVMNMADKIAAMPRMGLTLAKQAVNFAEDAMGLREGIDHSFALHQLAHASSAEVSGGDALLGATPASLKQADRG
ncbi:MAG: enoyl-CoA hydratase [Chloroflexota bacterium]|nr:enoyl-CoA hydratase [Chloroflexota bacterium]